MPMSYMLGASPEVANLVKEIRNNTTGATSVEDRMWIDEPDDYLDCPLGDSADFTYEELSQVVSTLHHAE